MKKILVVDDTKNIRTLLTTCLEIEGYEVVAANSGQQALSLIISESFDLVFLDIKMPEISGTEVLRKIRDLGITLPVVIMTAFATVKNAVECTKLGAVVYLQKPFTAEKIKSVLKDLSNNTIDNSLNCFDNTIETARELINEGYYAKALELLKQMLSKELDNPDVYLLLSKAYEGLGDAENASKFYKVYQVFKS